jgi:dTDP-4-dehydrorhamnose reductase
MTRGRVLITGGTGLLAVNWACAIRDEMDVILGTHNHSTKIKGVKESKLNLSDIIKLNGQIQEIRPDIIIHTAGLTNVETCEKNPELAFHINAQIAENVSIVASKNNIKLIHISTDHLFSNSMNLFHEESETSPINEYAKSKLLAEELVLKVNPSAIIVRTNFFCWGYKNRQSFSDWIIYSLRAGKKLSMFEDVYITPILADTLALLSHELATLNMTGIFNITGDEKISKYDFALKLAKAFDLPVRNITKDCLANSSLIAMRPNNMSLDNSKVSKILEKKIGNLEIFFSNLQSQEQNGRANELFDAVF